MRRSSVRPGRGAALRRWLRPLVVFAIFLVAILLGAAVFLRSADPRPSGEPAVPAVSGAPAVHVLTPDGDDTYLAAGSGSSVTVAAPPGNTGGNLRVAIIDPGTDASRDQEVCASWTGPVVDHIQPGLALRVRTTDGFARAITVTSSVWGDLRWHWNVHLWDAGQLDLLSTAALDLSTDRPGVGTTPWDMCARAVGRRVEFVVWPDAQPRPSWSDPDHSGRVTLPAGWEAPGVPGWYAGHLAAGQATTYVDRATWSLEGDLTAPPRWPAS